jgi:hypothetical protein
MDYTQPQFWIALSIGGASVATLSAVQQWYTLKQAPEAEFRIRPVLRDFCIGAFLTSIIYMFLPDSITSMIESGQKSLSSYTSSMMPAQQSGGGSIDMQDAPKFEIKTGPARF